MIDFTLPDYIETELKFVNKGITSYILDDELYFILLSDLQDLDLISESNSVSVELDPILRDEFPSVRIIITFNLDGLRIKNFDHYFSLESDTEIEHLLRLNEDKYIVLVLYNDVVRYIRKYPIDESDLRIMKSVLDEINDQVDKTGQLNDNKRSI